MRMWTRFSERLPTQSADIEVKDYKGRIFNSQFKIINNQYYLLVDGENVRFHSLNPVFYSYQDY